MTKRAVVLPENDEKTAPRLLLGHLYTTQVGSLGGVFQHFLGEPPADTEIRDVRIIQILYISLVETFSLHRLCRSVF